MTRPSALATFVAKTEKLPKAVQKLALTLMMRNGVKMVGTSKIDVLELTHTRVHLRIQNRRIVQNHIGGVHAAAMALLAETATGFVASMNIPGDRLPLLKHMDVKYIKRAKGALEAIATLDADAITILTNEPKGELLVPVVVTDEDGQNPIEAKMTWAWIPKKK